MNNLKMTFNFKIGEQEISKEIETSQESLRTALEGKIWRTAIVLKNSYNANAKEREQLKAYLAENSDSIDIERLMTDAEYKKSLKEKASKIEIDEPSQKDETDFIDKAIEKVLSGGGQND